MRKLLLFDLDGTLLRSDKTISARTVEALKKCKKMGYAIGISTSRSEQNCLSFLKEIEPDILISSAGALIRYGNDYINKNVFSNERTKELIQTFRAVCGNDVEITVDTIDKHYWNYKIDPTKTDTSWGESIWTDYKDFSGEALKICVQIFEDENARALERHLADCDMIRFSDGFWYKFTRKGVTKESAVKMICDKCGIKVSDITAFGDDHADIEMLKLSGIGIAMGNAVDEVKEAADIVIGTNDEDGIAVYLESV
ncbi:MAG: HAD family phosphatase [Ruminococcus sp.]|nr:HAD family phosphatase [Ruminococcus sp.]